MSDDDEGRSRPAVRLADLEAECARLRAENARLRTARVEELDELIDETALARAIAGLAPAEVADQYVRLNDVFIPTVTRLLLLFMFREDGTPYNYVEWQVGGVPETGPMTLTLQRVEGKTPNELRLAAQAEADALRAAVDAATALETFYLSRHWAMYEDEASLWMAFATARRAALKEDS